MKFAVVGDYLVQRRLPSTYEGFEEIRQWIGQADAKYCNMETTINREGECHGHAFCGGSYLRANPEVLEDCKRFGFNMTTWCNNHTLDFDTDGVAKTYDYMEASGLVHAGAGKNLDQAAAPAYLDTPNGRVALIGFTSSVNSTYDDVGIAGKQSRRLPGRPGVNQLRYDTILKVTPEQMAMIKDIAEQTSMNAGEDIARAEGYRAELPAGTFKLGKHVYFEEADHTHKITRCNKKDLERLDKAIFEAKMGADQIIVGVHSHQLDGKTKETISQFIQEFAHHAIDQGADAVVGHGPHLLRAMEIYKGKPIFYSLGDFILQNENAPFMPEDYYEAQGVTSDATMHEIFARRSKNFTRGLMTDKRMFESVIPRWEVQDGKIVKLELLAIELGFEDARKHGGVPAPAKDSAILERYAELSKPFGVEMEINGNIATVKL